MKGYAIFARPGVKKIVNRFGCGLEVHITFEDAEHRRKSYYGDSKIDPQYVVVPVTITIDKHQQVLDKLDRVGQ